MEQQRGFLINSMKRIILICSLIISGLIAFSQPIVNRASQSNTVSDGRLQAQYNLFTPRYNDTTSANLQKGIDSCGAIIYTRFPQAKWTRYCNPKRWVRDIDVENIQTFIDSASNNISVLDSNTFIICNGSGICDTFHTGINFTTIQFITDSSVEVCHADTITNSVVSICDTINVGTQPNPYIFQNWLRRDGNIVEFGATTPQGNGYFIGHDTYVNNGQFTQMYFDNWGIYNHGYNFRKPTGIGFQLGSGLVSFLHQNGNPATSGDNATNLVPLNIDWTGNSYQTSPFMPGYFGSTTQGYVLGTNGGGAGSYGWYLADKTRPTVGLVMHTDNTGKGVSIYGAAQNTAYGQSGNAFAIAEPGDVGLQNYVIADFYTNKNIQLYGYDSTIRNDGILTKVLGTDEFGNVLLGTAFGVVKNRYSIVKGLGDSLQLANDSALFVNPAKVYSDYNGDRGWHDGIIVDMANDTVNKVPVSNGDGTNFHLANVGFGRAQFTVGQPNVPAGGDSTYSIPSLEGKYIKAYRYGELQSFDTTFGIEVDTSVGEIKFHPPLETNEKIIIESYDYSFVSSISLPSPPPTWTDLTFTTNTDLLNTSGVWTATASNAWGQFGLDTKTLAGDGSYRVQYAATDGNECIIGFNASNTSQDFTNYEYGVFISSGGVVFKVVNGTPSTISYSLSIGDYVMLNRTGSTFTIQTSPDGVTWTVRYTFAATSTATFYVNLDVYQTGKCYYPQGLGLL